VTQGYDKELKEARRMVDETAKDKAKLQFEFGQMKTDYLDLKNKADKKVKESAGLQKQLTQLETQVDALNTQNHKLTNERDKLSAEKKDLDAEVARLFRELDILRKKMEEETLARVDAENKLKTQTEDAAFKCQQFEERLEETRTRRTLELQEVDGRLQQEYELKLQQSIQELRAENEAQQRANKDELDSLYEQKVGDLKNQLKRLQNNLAARNEEASNAVARTETLTSQVTKLEQERNSYLEKIKQLEKKMDDVQRKFAQLLLDRDDDIDRLVSEKNTLMNEYQDLMDIKIGLDNEISMYRKLLEGEEKRLSISPRTTRQDLDTQSRRTPLRGGLKRKRGGMYEEFSVDDSASSYETQAEGSGDIEILEDDPEGKYIKLRNKSDKEVSLSGWQLVRRVGTDETTHKFHRSVKVDKDAILAIYSSDVAGVASEANTTIIMKGQKWFAGDHIVTELLNNSGEMVAKRESKRVQIARQRKRLGFASDPEELFHQEPNGTGAGDRCVIM
jgi:lamin B